MLFHFIKGNKKRISLGERKYKYMSEYANTIKADYKKHPLKAINQLEWCNYENEAGILKNNIAWIAIKELFEDKQYICKSCGDVFFDSGHEGYCSEVCFKKAVDEYYMALASQIRD